jgi:glycosyltransferase involved in cell wall biosynthesis
MGKLLSIIVPAFNAEQYLYETVKSVTTCQRKDIEIILVDDGSTDRTAEICDLLSSEDYRIRGIHTQNSGVSSARNLGIKEAMGKYIFFLDADDEVITENLESVLELLETSNFSFLVFPYQVVSEKLVYIRTVDPFEEGTIELLDFYKCIVRSTYMNFCWGKFFKRDFLLQHNIQFDCNLKIGEDVKFQLDLMNYLPSVIYIKKDIVRYRQVRTSVMHQYSFNNFETIKDAYSIRNQIADRIGMSCNEREIMYRDLGTNLLSCVKHISKLENIVHISRKLKSVMKNDELQLILQKIPLKDIRFVHRVILFLLKCKLYFGVVLILRLV